MSRPEHIAPPEIFYDDREARKYTNNSRIIKIQSQLSRRCIELLNIPKHRPGYILDIGCGSGLSGEQLTRAGHHWVGVDISSSMLDVATERDSEGDLFLQDMGQGVCFRPGAFDGAISVSALQWLCNADKSSHHPRKRLLRFFETLYASVAHGARAVFQMYPESPRQIEMITSCAMKAGFTGGLVIDYPHSTKAKKYFLCLFAGIVSMDQMPQAKDGIEYDTELESEEEEEEEEFEGESASDDSAMDDDLDSMPSDVDETMDLTSSDIPFQDKTPGRVTYSDSSESSKKRAFRESIKKRQAREKFLKQHGGIMKSKSWIENKKDSARKQGKQVRPHSKYTGRKRKSKF